MRGILMIEPLYHQTIKGNKTQTRRSGGLESVNEYPDAWHYTGLSPLGEHTFEVLPRTENGFASAVRHTKPRYKVGEVLYIKEPTRRLTLSTNELEYKYDLPQVAIREKLKWANKLFMGVKDARVFIRIAGIKCERLMDISDEDCVAEGIEGLYYDKWRNYLSKVNSDFTLKTRKESFISLYKFANKVKEVPDLWVFCYTYEYLKDYNNDR